MVSFSGQFKLEPHPHWSPFRGLFEFSDEHSRHPPPGEIHDLSYLLQNSSYTLSRSIRISSIYRKQLHNLDFSVWTFWKNVRERASSIDRKPKLEARHFLGDRNSRLHEVHTQRQVSAADLNWPTHWPFGEIYVSRKRSKSVSRSRLLRNTSYCRCFSLWFSACQLRTVLVLA